MRNKKSCIRKHFFTLLFLLFTSSVFAQKNYNHAFGILSENDSYLLMGKDGYYTNGLTLFYSWTAKDTNRTAINSVEVGQLMYNAKNGSYQELWKIDRPVTAYLFGRYNRTQFFRQNVLDWKIGVGTIGPNAFGRQVQEFIHRTLKMYKPQEWQFQLKNALAIDASVSYAPQVFREQPIFNIYPILASDIGMTYTNIKAGGIITIGKKSINNRSILWNAYLNNATETMEHFFYVKPILTYNIYNATVQGNLFSDDPHAGVLNRIIFTPKFGWMYVRKRFSLDICIDYTGREAQEQLRSQWYGGFKFGWYW